MSKTMSTVLAEHQRYVSYCGPEQECECGVGLGANSDASIADHQAQALSAAGFGLVADAKAEALAGVKQVMARLNNEAINANEGAKYAAQANDGASLRALEAERFAYQLAHRLLHVAIRGDS